MILSETDARGVLLRVLGISKAETTEATVSGGPSGHIRFALNNVTTSGISEDLRLTVRCSHGRRAGFYTVNQLDDDSIHTAVARAEELARLAPDDPEFVPVLPPQTYPTVEAYFDETASLGPADRAHAAKAAIAPARNKKLVSAGFFESQASFGATLNSMGNFVYQRRTRCGFSTTIRTSDGTGSGYTARSEHRAGRLDAEGLAKRALEKALRSQNPRTMEPGKYPVILEPEAVDEFLGFLGWSLLARSADEGRNFFSKLGGGNKIGEKVASDSVTIYTDPADPDVPGASSGPDGVPSRKMFFVENGVLKNLLYDRYWASKTGHEPVPAPTNFLMSGGSSTVDDLIRSTDRGVLVTRFFYIRMVDPQSILLTGLTRDGTFWIEKGRIAHPIKNFRFNESPMNLLSNVEALSKPERTGSGNGVRVPGIKAKEFNFSSLSEAV